MKITRISKTDRKSFEFSSYNIHVRFQNDYFFLDLILIFFLALILNFFYLILNTFNAIDLNFLLFAGSIYIDVSYRKTRYFGTGKRTYLNKIYRRCAIDRSLIYALIHQFKVERR